MPTQLALYTNETGGYALDASTGAGFNFDELYSANFHSWQAAVARGAPDYLYIFGDDHRTFARSTDSGSNWTISTITAWPSGAVISNVAAHAVDDLHVFQNESAGALAGYKGIWRSTNGGTTWTQVVTLANTLSGRGGQLAAGATKLWYAEATSTTAFAIKTCNWDGTGITTIGSITYVTTFPPVLGVKLRPFGDDFVLVVAPDDNKLHKVTSGGTITSIKPASMGRVWEADVFDANTYVAAGQDVTGGVEPTTVHRTTDGGSSWTLVQSIDDDEGFAKNSSFGFTQIDVVYGSTTDAYMMGNATSSVQQFVWKTTNAGSTWTSFRNEAQLEDVTGWLDYGSSGVLALAPVTVEPAVAIPSRLATIVG